MPIDIHLLNKIRSVKALRDKGATDGERDAAQHRLTVLLARHKLTEQDIPPDSFSTRHRPPPRPNRQRPRSGANSKTYTSEAAWNAAFDETLRRFREAAEGQARQDRPYTPPPHRTEHGVKKKPSGRIRFEQTFGHPISDAAWRYVKLAQTETQKKYKPSNPNAFSRAFYEFAAASLRGRIYGAYAFRSKTNNTEGQFAGETFGRTTPTDVFTTAS